MALAEGKSDVRNMIEHQFDHHVQYDIHVKSCAIRQNNQLSRACSDWNSSRQITYGKLLAFMHCSRRSQLSLIPYDLLLLSDSLANI